jgi:hypothetical protein
LDAVQLTLEQIDLIKRLADLNPEHLTLVTSVKGKTFTENVTTMSIQVWQYYSFRTSHNI